MRKLILIALTATLLYGGYWFIGKSQIEARLSEGLTRIDAGAYDLSYDSLRTRGFPSRFDTTITDLTFEDPQTQLKWETPILQLLALAYQPNNVRAYFPEEQVFTLGDQAFTLFTTNMEARGQVSATPSLSFQQGELELINPRLRSAKGAELAMARLFSAMRLTPETEKTYDAFLEARSIVLPQDMRDAIDPLEQQPPIIQSIRFDSDVTLSAPIELTSAGNEVHLQSIYIRELAVTWGDLSVSAIGDLMPDAAGLLNGSVTISARNWQQALELAIASGKIKDDRRFLVQALTTTLDETPQISDTLTVTLTFTRGEMAFGGYPVGRAPALR